MRLRSNQEKCIADVGESFPVKFYLVKGEKRDCTETGQAFKAVIVDSDFKECEGKKYQEKKWNLPVLGSL